MSRKSAEPGGVVEGGEFCDSSTSLHYVCDLSYYSSFVGSFVPWMKLDRWLRGQKRLFPNSDCMSFFLSLLPPFFTTFLPLTVYPRKRETTVR